MEMPYDCLKRLPQCFAANRIIRDGDWTGLLAQQLQRDAASWTSVADIVSKTSFEAAWAAGALGEVLKSAIGFPGNSKLPTSQSSMFLKEPGIPRAYSGQEIRRPSA